MVPDIGDITADHSLTPIHAMTEVAVLDSTTHTLLPATAAVQTTLHPVDTPITPHAIVIPHPTLATSPTGTTHATPLTTAGLTPSTPTIQHKDPKIGKLSNAQNPQPPQKPHHPKTVTIQDSYSDPSSNSDSDSNLLNY